MGFADKFKNFVNGGDDVNDGYDGYDDGGNDYGDEPDVPEFQNQQSAPAPAHQTYGGGNASLELKMVRPERFESVTQIADHLLNNRTVVLNLEATNKETARRMIDFLSGVAYSIDGNLKKAANNTYVITPGNVAVSSDQAPASAQFQQQAQGEEFSNL